MPYRDIGGNTLLRWYPSRSEAEQAVVLHAVWCGWEFAELAELFEQYKPGHYAAHKNRARYLRICWQNAIGYLADTPERATIAELWQWAESRPWPGRGGGNEYLTYRTLLQRAWLANTLEPDVSRRDIELNASMGSTGARGALRRLVNQGVIAPHGQRQRPTAALTWRLLPDVDTIEQHEKHATCRDVDALPGGAEMWAMLGRSAGMVYTRLSQEPQQISDLATATGKHRNTVRKALNRLSGFGLAFKTDSGWIVGDRNPAEVAHDLGAAEAKGRREFAITHQRETFRKVLAQKCA